MKNLKTMTAAEALEICQSEVQKAGYRVSAGSWASEERGMALAYSIESGGPAVYGHPDYEISAIFYDGSWKFVNARNRYFTPPGVR
jgi:hypothetical protein